MPNAFSPQRVAALQPSVTDTLARLGLLDRVVACTRYCTQVVPEASSGRVVISDSWSATASEILAVRPDLIIASVPYQPEALAQILKSGTRFLGLAPKTLSNIYGDIAAIAGIMGAPERGANVITEMQETIESVRATAQTASTRPRAYCEEWGKPIIAAEPWVAELVEAAAGIFLGAAGQPIDADAIRRAAPQVIIFAWTGAGDRIPVAKVIAERGWQDVPPSVTTAFMWCTTLCLIRLARC